MRYEVVPFATMKLRFAEILIKNGFREDKAERCAQIFTENSLDGVYTHGLNRFPIFIEMVRDGLVDSNATPVLESNNGLIEQWNGNLAPGMLNAELCMKRAIFLAGEHGIGCVAIRNTNHWMRGGTYGWQAADAGCIGICFTNTTALVPPWGGVDPTLGNNPVVIAVPRNEGHVVLDVALSQYSMGKLMQYETLNQELPTVGGYDENGKLSTKASTVLATQRLLPIGFWKGSGLSLMVDILVTILSKGKSTGEIAASGGQSGVSQAFICIRQDDKDLNARLIEQILDFTKTSRPENPGKPVSYPGENTLRTRQRNLKEGIPVDKEIWDKVLRM